MGRGDGVTAATPLVEVTFLCTDVEGSTRRWEANGDGMQAAIIVRAVVLRNVAQLSWCTIRRSA
jgi:class 3 adenylate cyclase